MHNGISCFKVTTAANSYNLSRSSAESSEEWGEESCCSYQGRTVIATRAGENSGISASEALRGKRNTSSSRACQRIDGHMGKYFGVLLRFIHGESEQRDYVELYRLKLVSLVEVLEKLSAKRGEIPKSLFDVIRYLAKGFKLPAPLPEDLVTEEFCFSAVKANNTVFDYIPDKFKSQRLLKYILKQVPKLIKNKVPENTFTEELLQFVLENHVSR